MAPNDPKKRSNKGPAQRHLHSRISYLYQAAIYLVEATGKQKVDIKSSEVYATANAVRETEVSAIKGPTEDNDSKSSAHEFTLDLSRTNTFCKDPNAALSRQLLGHLRTVSLKGQIRLAPEMKHSICKRCNSPLVPGSSATTHVENKSRGRAKSWADVLVTACNGCGAAKRVPTGAKRQVRRSQRLVRNQKEEKI